MVYGAVHNPVGSPGGGYPLAALGPPKRCFPLRPSLKPNRSQPRLFCRLTTTGTLEHLQVDVVPRAVKLDPLQRPHVRVDRVGGCLERPKRGTARPDL